MSNQTTYAEWSRRHRRTTTRRVAACAVFWLVLACIALLRPSYPLAVLLYGRAGYPSVTTTAGVSVFVADVEGRPAFVWDIDPTVIATVPYTYSSTVYGPSALPHLQRDTFTRGAVAATPQTRAAEVVAFIEREGMPVRSHISPQPMILGSTAEQRAKVALVRVPTVSAESVRIRFWNLLLLRPWRLWAIGVLTALAIVTTYLIAFNHMRVLLRLRRNLCPRCTYPAHPNLCPECGLTGAFPSA